MITSQSQNHVKQRDWRWPAAANFIIGGIGVGLYFSIFIKAFMTFDLVFLYKALSFGLIPPILIGIGFLFLAIEAGRPTRGFYLFLHPGQSWITRETFACSIFIPAALCDYFFPFPAFKLLAIISASGFLISQGFILYRARAIAAWNVPVIPLVFASSGLTSGYGLFLMLIAPDITGSDQAMLFFGLVCLIFNLSVWLIYLWISRSPGLFFVTSTLRQAFSLTLTIGIGQIIPLILLFFMIGQKNAIAPLSLTLIICLCGIMLLIGNIGQKFGVIIFAGYFRTIELNS
jgi:formate-dependent nitrite reductase membrane component NrfD